MTAASGSVSSDRTYTYDQNGNEIKIVDSVAETGRFLSEDTYRGETDDADSWHLYAYCANNPIKYVDPSGHSAISIVAEGFASIMSSVGTTAIAPVLGGIILTCSFAKITQKIQERVRNAMVAVGVGISLRVAERAIDKATVEAKRIAKPKPKGPIHRHHIVAKGASNAHAASSRNLLAKYKIGINSTRNLVSIHQNVHSVMHTKNYYRGVCTFLRQKPINRTNVLQRLAKLKVAIKILDKTINPE